ncbi:MAG: penicillin-binding transpeptidase domain-containing protein, partial [Ruminococcus sp.]|nr:penicillin-binding transpeptidase domain-containing protein [Ruminococcus sp.]
SYECKGSVKIGDVTFKCYSDKAHGKETMTEALENSCNTYFINLLEQIDADYLLALCRSLGFSSSTEIADSIIAAKGALPQNKDLLYPGERANFSFGQGKLLATPIQMLSAYHALATGNYVCPTVIYGTANADGLIKTQSNPQTRKIFTAKTVKTMREMLSSVVENGNAQKAQSELMKLAGKTGTAQSGIYKNKIEVCRTWFSGFFPAENPHYIVIILNEDGESGSTDCAPVFKKICEGIVGED